jgi:hypothetical protein
MAVNHRLIARAVRKANPNKSGRVRIPQVGVIPNHTPIAITRTKPTIQSTSPPRVAAMGIMTRGKYTFVMRLDSLETLVLLRSKLLEKYPHGSMAEYTNNGYGTPSDGILAQ